MLSETAAISGRAADCSGLASAGLVITCEHGGNEIPRDLAQHRNAGDCPIAIEWPGTAN